MNLTIGNTFPNTWKRLRMEYIAAAAVAAIAVSAFAVAAWPSGGSTPRASVAPPAPFSSAATAAQEHTLYIVESQAAADALAAGSIDGLLSYDVMVAPFDDVTAGGLLQTLFAEDASGYLNVKVIDLRGR